ncbi:hypothetical protein [Syntrophomonas palmitatica]|uniref:hypothetical protein n=1 Tax=Syntrophomonas palmitatica TaxID=402877 RepID=UPI0006CFC7D1|nr:hypothetical protein [Syntrophomonas palmitatica]
MQELPGFELKFIQIEEHLLLPNVTSIKVVQHLYDVLFQYAITEEYEQKLKVFISRLEEHIKQKLQIPFSMPLSDLQFLDEGLEELRLLNWMQQPLARFEIIFTDKIENEDEALETVLDQLQNYLNFKRVANSKELLVFPLGITLY